MSSLKINSQGDRIVKTCCVLILERLSSLLPFSVFSVYLYFTDATVKPTKYQPYLTVIDRGMWVGRGADGHITKGCGMRQLPVHFHLSANMGDSAVVTFQYETVVIRIWISFHSHSGSHPDNTCLTKSTRWNWPVSSISRAICATQPWIIARGGGAIVTPVNESGLKYHIVHPDSELAQLGQNESTPNYKIHWFDWPYCNWRRRTQYKSWFMN